MELDQFLYCSACHHQGTLVYPKFVNDCYFFQIFFSSVIYLYILSSTDRLFRSAIYLSIYIYIYIYIYILSSTYRLFRSVVYIYIYVYIPSSFCHRNTLSGGKSCLVALGVAVPPWATETVLSPWLAADEVRVSHVLSHVVWWKKYIYIVIHRRTVSFYQNSTVWSWDRNLADCNANPRCYPSVTRDPTRAKEI